jgi:hypothetical protein
MKNRRLEIVTEKSDLSQLVGQERYFAPIGKRWV